MKSEWKWLFVACLVAVFATTGALFLGEVMGMMPCTLCWYQRIVMFPLALILSVACYSDDRCGADYGLWLAVTGLLISGYHTLLVAGLVSPSWLPCGAGPSCAQQRLDIFDGIQIPWLSLAAFALISLSLLIYLKKTSK